MTVLDAKADLATQCRLGSHALCISSKCACRCHRRSVAKVVPIRPSEPGEGAISSNEAALIAAQRDREREYQRAYYDQNREAIAEYQRAYRDQNREAIAEKQRAKLAELTANPDDPRHGMYGYYSIGCRCEAKCRPAARQYQAQRRPAS